MKNIVLYWMRWSGKTTIWKKLAEKLQLKFFDLDEEIQKDIWLSVFDFVETNWWNSFREKEHQNLKRILQINEDKIISLWWWTITFENNQEILLKKSDKLIYIECPIDIIRERIEKDEIAWNKRNSLTNKWLFEELQEIYNKRKACYESFFDFSVNNNASLENCVKNILKKVNFWKICVPIIDFEPSYLREQIWIINSTKEIWLVELRIDYIEENKENEIFGLIKNIKKQIIITNRNSLEWWKFDGNVVSSIDKIIRFYQFWDYFDIELLTGDKIKTLKNTIDNKKLIISYHNFNQTPDLDYLKRKIKEMSIYKPEVYKIAVMPKNSQDINIIYQLQEYFENNYIWSDYIFISMWELWKETRIKIPKKWSLLTFWSLKDSSAPWQINYSDLYNIIFNQ